MLYRDYQIPRQHYCYHRPNNFQFHNNLCTVSYSSKYFTTNNKHQNIKAFITFHSSITALPFQPNFAIFVPSCPFLCIFIFSSTTFEQNGAVRGFSSMFLEGRMYSTKIPLQLKISIWGTYFFDHIVWTKDNFCDSETKILLPIQNLRVICNRSSTLPFLDHEPTILMAIYGLWLRFEYF